MSKKKLKIIYKPLSEIVPYDQNVMDHSEEQVEAICKSIQEYGFNNPVLVDSNNLLVAGHGRLLAAEKLGMEEVPCLVLGHLSDAQRRAYAIADNKIPRQSTFNLDVLSSELQRLAEEEVNLEAISFQSEELELLLSNTPELPEEFAYTPNYTAKHSPGTKPVGGGIDYSSSNKEIDLDNFDTSMTLSIKMEEEQYFEAKRLLSEIDGDLATALLTALKAYSYAEEA